LIQALLGFFMLIFAAGYYWWMMQTPMLESITRFTARFPTYFAAEDVAFMRAVVHWFPWLIVIGAFVWLIVFIQRSSPEGYYYG